MSVTLPSNVASVLEKALPVAFDLSDVEIDKAHRENVIGEKGELIFFVRVFRLKCVP